MKKEEPPRFYMRKRLSLQVGELIAPAVKPALQKRGIAEFHLIQHWPEIIGEAMAALCLPDRVRFPYGKKTDGTLYLRVAHGWGVEIQHQTPVISERIATYLGYAAISQIVVIQDSELTKRLTAQKARHVPPVLSEEDETLLHDRLESVASSELKERLASLGRYVAARNTCKPSRKS